MTEQRKAVIKNADMSEDMQQDAVDIASQALSKYNNHTMRLFFPASLITSFRFMHIFNANGVASLTNLPKIFCLYQKYLMISDIFRSSQLYVLHCVCG